MSYGFIRDHVAVFPVAILCEVLGVSRSGYYDWARRPESRQAAADRVLAAEIRATHADSRGRYGSPRVHAALRAQGRRVGRKRVARLMRGMVALPHFHGHCYAADAAVWNVAAFCSGVR